MKFNNNSFAIKFVMIYVIFYTRNNNLYIKIKIIITDDLLFPHLPTSFCLLFHTLQK